MLCKASRDSNIVVVVAVKEATAIVGVETN